MGGGSSWIGCCNASSYFLHTFHPILLQRSNGSWNHCFFNGFGFPNNRACHIVSATVGCYSYWFSNYQHNIILDFLFGKNDGACGRTHARVAFCFKIDQRQPHFDYYIGICVCQVWFTMVADLAHTFAFGRLMFADRIIWLHRIMLFDFHSCRKLFDLSKWSSMMRIGAVDGGPFDLWLGRFILSLDVPFWLVIISHISISTVVISMSISLRFVVVSLITCMVSTLFLPFIPFAIFACQ